jgi:hypothetical protein
VQSGGAALHGFEPFQLRSEAEAAEQARERVPDSVAEIREEAEAVLELSDLAAGELEQVSGRQNDAHDLR